MSEENTTGTVLYLLHGSVKESDYVCHPNESLIRESVYLWPVTGCRYWARARIYTASHKFNTIDEICCKCSMWFYALPFFLSVETPVIPLIMQKLQYQKTFPWCALANILTSVTSTWHTKTCHMKTTSVDCKWTDFVYWHIILPDQKCSKSIQVKHGNTSNDFPLILHATILKICMFGCNYFSLTQVHKSHQCSKSWDECNKYITTILYCSGRSWWLPKATS